MTGRAARVRSLAPPTDAGPQGGPGRSTDTVSVGKLRKRRAGMTPITYRNHALPFGNHPVQRRRRGSPGAHQFISGSGMRMMPSLSA